ncbi:hypothetical protein KO361_04390 [Candidatus Woesearchaeota archaeon]|nr:hypothetical protein [Candidatus Woesearchaeota archaeon]
MINFIERSTEIKKEGYHTLTSSEDFILYEDQDNHQFIIEYESRDETATITLQILEDNLYEYTITTPIKSLTFIHKKGLHDIGQTTQEQLFKQLLRKIDEADAIPSGAGGSQTRIKALLEELYLALPSYRKNMKETFRAWLRQQQLDKVPGFLEAIGEVDNFTETTIKKAREQLYRNNVIDHVYDAIQLRVVAQESKAILDFLIALSSVLNKPIHSIVTANPGKSKSTISETVFELFPRQRRLEFNSETTSSGLMNMTKYKEGKHVLKNKLIKLGDFGDTKEQEAATEIISILKIMMSEGKYTKILTNMEDEFGRAMILQLKGIGSVHLEVVTPTVESQYQSRALLWSPDDNRDVQHAIMEHQEDELGRKEKEYDFKKKRDIVACMIEEIYQHVEGFKKDGWGFDVFNPFTSHFNALLNVKASPNANRDRMMIQMIPKLVTLVNCFNRHIIFNDKLKQYALIVSVEDYIYTLKVLGETLSRFIHKKPEVYGTYLTIIEDKLLPKTKPVLSFDDYKIGFEKREKYRSRKIEDIYEIDREYAEFIEILDDSSFYTYKDIAKYTTLHDRTVRRYIQEMRDMGLVFIDESHTPHRVYLVSDYVDQRENAFKNITDFKALYDGNGPYVVEVSGDSISCDELYIKKLYDSFMRSAYARGWVFLDEPEFNGESITFKKEISEEDV